MGNTNSNTNEDLNYINENNIQGHGNPISFIQLKDILEKGENSMVKIETIGKIGAGFFFNKIFQQ